MRNTAARPGGRKRPCGQRAHSRAIRAAARWLTREQNADGGFSFSRRGGASDVDDTGAALQALASARSAPAKLRVRALAYLHRSQNLDGGFGQLTGSRSNAQSTAWAIQGLVALGRNPGRFRTHGGHAALVYLVSLQQADGSFRYSRTSVQTPVWVTAQAITAARRKPFPLEPPKRANHSRAPRRRKAAVRAAGPATKAPVGEGRHDHRSRRALIAAKLGGPPAHAGRTVEGTASRNPGGEPISALGWTAIGAGTFALAAALLTIRRVVRKRAEQRI